MKTAPQLLIYMTISTCSGLYPLLKKVDVGNDDDDDVIYPLTFDFEAQVQGI